MIANLSPERLKLAQDQLNGLLTRSTTDPEFRRQLVSSPREAMSQHFGREIPETVNIRFIDAQGRPMAVLPDPVVNGELSEHELETVAGGLIPALIGIGAALYVIGDLIIN